MNGVEDVAFDFQDIARAGGEGALCSGRTGFQLLEAFAAETGRDSFKLLSLGLKSGVSAAALLLLNIAPPEAPGYRVTLLALSWFALERKLSSLARLMMDSS
jgi:hypothetical protein